MLVRYHRSPENQATKTQERTNEVSPMNQEKEAEKALLSAIQELGVYGVQGVPRLLQALSWWADSRGLHGYLVSNLRNDLAEQQENADTLQGLLDEIGAADISGAIKMVQGLAKEVDSLEDEVVKLEEACGLRVAALEAERDEALREASLVP